MTDTITSFYVEHGRTHYGPFETADDAANYGSQQLKLGLELQLGIANVVEYRGRLMSEEPITKQEWERLNREGIPQADGSVIFHVTAENGKENDQ